MRTDNCDLTIAAISELRGGYQSNTYWSLPLKDFLRVLFLRWLVSRLVSLYTHTVGIFRGQRSWAKKGLAHWLYTDRRIDRKVSSNLALSAGVSAAATNSFSECSKCAIIYAPCLNWMEVATTRHVYAIDPVDCVKHLQSCKTCGLWSWICLILVHKPSPIATGSRGSWGWQLPTSWWLIRGGWCHSVEGDVGGKMCILKLWLLT